jgi:hypothetical protein
LITKCTFFLATWHLLIGGKGDGLLNSVEMYNWQTKRYCDFTAIPRSLSGMVGTVINTNIVFCGGTGPTLTSNCYKLINSTWVEVSFIKFVLDV